MSSYDRGPDALPRDGAPDIRIIGAPRRPPLDRSSMLSRPGVLYTSWTSPSWLRPYALVKIRNLAPRPIRYPRTAFPYPLSFTDRPAYHPLTSALWVDRGRAYPEGRTRTDGRTERRPERARRAERHHDERHHNSSHVFELDTAETGGEHSERPPDESLVV